MNNRMSFYNCTVALSHPQSNYYCNQSCARHIYSAFLNAFKLVYCKHFILYHSKQAFDGQRGYESYAVCLVTVHAPLSSTHDYHSYYWGCHYTAYLHGSLLCKHLLGRIMQLFLIDNTLTIQDILSAIASYHKLYLVVLFCTL